MAVITQSDWTARTGNTVSGAAATAVDAICAAVSEALPRMCYPVLIEPLTLTLAAFDAPPEQVLLLPRPIREITALHWAPGANGDSTRCDSTTLLTAGTDYYSPVDDLLAGLNRSGVVYRRGSSSVWGAERVYPLGKLGYRPDPARGEVFVSGTFGPASVPEVVAQAASAAVSILFARRAFGVGLGSESWNGYSISPSSQFLVDALGSPDVREPLRLAGYLPVHIF